MARRRMERNPQSHTMGVALLMVAVAVLVAIASSSEPSPAVFLPQNVRPKSYRLHLEPDLENFTFKGKVTIDLDVLESSNEIQFHSLALDIHSAVLEGGGPRGARLVAGQGGVPALVFDEDREVAVMSLGTAELEEGSAVLTLEYTGVINDDSIGFYRSAYTLDGKTKHMGVTQFEPTGARQALPCWDEPAIKATFSVSMVVPHDLEVLSNMPVVSTEPRSDGSTLVRFDETPVMSTYLLAFAVGDLEKVSGSTSAGTMVNVYTVPGKKELGTYALDAATRILPFFSEYFGIDYPLPKCDILAVPDFPWGAMENWGLLMFVEDGLLVVPGNTPDSTLQEVAGTVSHELAHQWFGNLVTMRWWTDLWLKEGFAVWAGVEGVGHIHPDWNKDTLFVTNEQNSALRTDALLSSHPVEVRVTDPDEIEQAYDALSYDKGGSIIRQLEAAGGAEAFQKGLQNYLEKHKYNSTTTRDLWNALAESSGRPVKEIMDTWTDKTGYPLVTVSEPAGGTPGLSLRQTRFLLKGPPTREEDDQLWEIDIHATLGTPGSTKISELPSFRLSTKEAVAQQFAVPEGGWIRLNAGNPGLFRVNYTPQLWKTLAEAVEAMVLPPVDRLGVVMDVFALAKAGVVPTTQALDLAFSLKRESEFAVWSSLAEGLDEVDLLVTALGARELFQEAGIALFRNVSARLGWDPKPWEGHLEAMLRPLVLGHLADYGDQPTVAKCLELFRAMQCNVTAVSPNLQSVVMSTAVGHGGREQLEGIKTMYQDWTLEVFQVDFLGAMAMVGDRELFKDFLDWTLDEDHVDAGDQVHVFEMIAYNADNRKFAWEYFKEHFDVLRKRLPAIPAVFVAIPAQFTTEEEAEDVEKFFAANPVPEAAMELTRVLETIRIRAAWLKRDGASMVSWLKANV